ncbi:MAG: hypothetical protein GXN93_05185 [Candidatus Diapherotrites archaeon]|nr:hypothetical protein [Candidatus Diapherotrites archaeon]
MISVIRRIYAIPSWSRPKILVGWLIGYIFLAGLALWINPNQKTEDLSLLVLAIAYTASVFVASKLISLPGIHPVWVILIPTAAFFMLATFLCASTDLAFWLLEGLGAVFVLMLALLLWPYRKKENILARGESAKKLFSENSSENSRIRLIVADPTELSDEERIQLDLLTRLGAIQIHPAAVLANLEGRLELDYVSDGDITEPPGSYLLVKRIVDLLLVLISMPIVLPLGILTSLALAISGWLWREDGGPVFFIQERVGFHGRPFRMVKFRTMRIGADREGPLYALDNDNRITRLGRWLRKFRLDEIPQLLNVIRGEMSLVGPRPEPVKSAAAFAKKIPHYDLRTLAPPGITGWAQVQQGYAAGDDETRVKLTYDLYYIKNASIYFDMYVLSRTVLTVILNRGAR